MLTDKLKIYGAHEGSQEATFVARFSGSALDPAEIAQVIADLELDYGADIQGGWGVWEGIVEQSVTVTSQTNYWTVEKMIIGILARFPDLRWVHVERHRPEVLYVDGDQLRDFYGVTV